jgi:hypothetical protein
LERLDTPLRAAAGALNTAGSGNRAGLWHRWIGKRNAGGGVLAMASAISTSTNCGLLKTPWMPIFGSAEVGTRQDTMQNQNASFGVYLEAELMESMSTQLESLILAQSERWRQA